MKNTKQRLYAIAVQNGLVEHGNKDDLFHLIVYNTTGKTSVKELTDKEIKRVETAIWNRTYTSTSPKVKNQKPVPNMMSPAQQSFAWRMMYQIQSYDLQPSTKTVGERLAGVIKKELGITASKSEPLKSISAKNGIILIEALKRYERSAKQKYYRQKSEKK